MSRQNGGIPAGAGMTGITFGIGILCPTPPTTPSQSRQTETVDDTLFGDCRGRLQRPRNDGIRARLTSLGGVTRPRVTPAPRPEGRQASHLTAPMFAAIATLAVLLTMVSCLGSADNSTAVERHKKLAGELRDSKLYSAAIEEYQKLLDYPDVDEKTRGNVNYLIGRIYFEDLNDYDQAAAYYIRARAIDPEGSYINEASRNLVASLEKMGQILDAKRQLGAATDLQAAPGQVGDIAVARVGGAPIWLSQVEQELQTLPPEVQKRFTSRQAKMEYVRQYVAVELLYRAALREAYDDDPEIERRQRLLLRKLLVDKYVLDKVMPQVTIDTADVRNFYLANQDEKYNQAPFDSVRAQVFLDYQAQKANAAFSDYIGMLSSKENVEFYDENVK